MVMHLCAGAAPHVAVEFVSACTRLVPVHGTTLPLIHGAFIDYPLSVYMRRKIKDACVLTLFRHIRVRGLILGTHTSLAELQRDAHYSYTAALPPL